MTTHVLTAYPLSQAYRLSLEKKIGFIPEYVLLSQLRSQSTRFFLKSLRQITGKMIIAIEDPHSQVILPIMTLIAHITRAKTITIADPKCAMQLSSRWDFLKTGFQFVGASLGARLQLIKTRRDVNQGLMAKPREIAIGDSTRILYVNANLWFGVKAGGSIGHVAGVANGFARKKFAVTYCAVEKNSFLDDAVIFLPMKPPKVFGIPYESNYYRFNHEAFLQLSSQLSTEKFRFLYQRLSLASYLGVSLSKAFNIPLVIEYNGSEAWIAQHWGRGLRYARLAHDVEKLCLQHANVVVTISDVLRDELITKGVDASRIVCYPNAIDPQIFSPVQYSKEKSLALRKQYDLEPDALVCTFVGTFGRWHGVPVLAKAIVQWFAEEPDYLEKHKIRFLLIGDGAQMPEVKQILSSMANQQLCRLPGLIPQQETPAFLAASDILLSPHVNNEDGSRFFGSPTKLFEYMAMEKPIIASNLEQLGEILHPALDIKQIRNNDTTPSKAVGILCEPGEPRDIIEAIRYLVENPMTREQLGQRARQKAMSQYTWEHHVDAILQRL